MGADEYRRTSLENWKTMAAGWERRRADIDSSAAPVREWLVRELDPQPGQTILELAAGPGDTGFAAATMLGDEGLLITTDFSPEMVEVSQRRADELGLHNVEFRVMDAERLDLDDESVDGVICRFAFMLMVDPLAALKESRRVLRPGGRLVFAVWRGPESNPWVSIAGRIFAARGLVPPPDPDAPSMFAMADDDRVHTLLEAAGFGHVRIEDVPTAILADDVEDYVASARDTGGVFARAFGQASEEEQEAVKRDLGEAFAPFAVAEGYALPGLALVAVAS
jgi:ubiquinone/menaquinone biosynthesis C-methylase UbiE